MFTVWTWNCQRKPLRHLDRIAVELDRCLDWDVIGLQEVSTRQDHTELTMESTRHGHVMITTPRPTGFRSGEDSPHRLRRPKRDDRHFGAHQSHRRADHPSGRYWARPGAHEPLRRGHRLLLGVAALTRGKRSIRVLALDANSVLHSHGWDEDDSDGEQEHSGTRRCHDNNDDGESPHARPSCDMDEGSANPQRRDVERIAPLPADDDATPASDVSSRATRPCRNDTSTYRRHGVPVVQR